MTLEEIAHIVGSFISKDLYPEEFVTLLDHAQDTYFFDNIDDEGIVFPFIKNMGNGTMPLKVTAQGYATLPTGFAKHLDLSIIYNGEAKQIERVETWEFSHRLTQAIEVPTREYPIATYQATRIKFAPKNLQAVNFTYLSHPPKPVYATIQQDGMLVYDPDNSTELLWTDHDQIEVIRILLRNLGIQVTSEQIKQKTQEQ